MEKMSGKCCIHIGRWVCSTVLVMSMVACDDALNNKTPDVPSEKGVPVELSFGFANEEDGYTLSGSGNTRSENALQEGGFSAQLIPNVDTRATADLKPDALYELHVIQYRQDGTRITTHYTADATEIGIKLTYKLTPADDCQLVIVARGKDNTSIGLNGNLANTQKQTVAKTIFENIPTSGATQDQINKMPYVLHLEHVKVTRDGKLQSIEGAHDARLLLKRLATKLTVKWNINSSMSSYTLKEVKLCQVPSTFRIIPSKTTTEWGTTYPSEVSEFIEFYRLTDTSDLSANTKTVWIPANVRGTSARATSPYYRTKDNAPTAASYMELVLDNSGRKERLYYRAYLGGVESTDFNLYGNKDYNWTVNINSANYTTDARITLLDQTPVTSSNLVSTSNCLMMQPGTNICFNPYKHEAGTGGWNTYLTNGSTLNKIISSVKVLWQTKDAGTSGDLVMGYVIDNTNHKNLVNITDASNPNNARVNVKVPVTQGGNAVIAASDASGNIIWSWHIWVSDYVPKGLEGTINSTTRASAIESARTGTQHGTVHTYGGNSFTDPNGAFYSCVMMDRNLGATRAGIQHNLADAIRTFGLLYQGARKDPFFSTADGTPSEVNTIYDGYGVAIAGGVVKSSENCTLDQSIQNPLTYYYGRETNYTVTWGGDNAKTIYDPCPKGWRVPSVTDVNDGLASFIAGFGSTDPGETYGDDPYKESYSKNLMYYNGTKFIELNYTNRLIISSSVVGSGYMYFGGSAENENSYTDKSAYFPGVALREQGSGNYRDYVINNSVYLWSSNIRDNNVTTLNHAQMQVDLGAYHPGVSNLGIVSTRSNLWNYGFSVRCIQDRIQKR